MKTFKKRLNTYELKKIQTDFPSVKITSSKDFADFARNFYGDDLEIFESFFILLLNNANNTIAYQKISQGGVTGTVVDVKLVMKYAVDCIASSIMLIHNHPSGTLKPSEADKSITQKIKHAAQYFDMRVLDHVILTADSYFSFADEGIL